MFYVGQLVVCVDDGFHDEWLLPGCVYTDHLDGLTAGRIYTIRDLCEHPLTGVRLEEIVRPILPGDYGEEVPYALERFRPVKETKIDVFTSILENVPTQALAS